MNALTVDFASSAGLFGITVLVASFVVAGTVVVLRDHFGFPLPPSRFSERGYAALVR